MRIKFRGGLKYAGQLLQGFEEKAGLSRDFSGFTQLLGEYAWPRLVEFSGDVELSLPADVIFEPDEDYFHPTMMIVQQTRKPKILIGISNLKPGEQSPEILQNILRTVVEANYLNWPVKFRRPSWRQRKRYDFDRKAWLVQISAAAPISFKSQPDFRHSSFKVWESEAVARDQRKGISLQLWVHRGENDVNVIEIHLSEAREHATAYNLAVRVAESVPRFRVCYSHFVLGKGWEDETIHKAWAWEMGRAFYI